MLKISNYFTYFCLATNRSAARFNVVKSNKKSRRKAMTQRTPAYELDFQTSCHKRRYMKIKSLGRLLGGHCPVVLHDQPTHPSLTFNTSVAVLFS